ncbi:MAG TPA: TetR/AcrR family transcriptional regulator [Acidimicrobiales bacterium]|nr:TetR/AcrR family transcriptional regulator [Acidimicrobiales bacterium]
MRQPLTREAIAKAARDILVAEGLHAVSLRRVAASLGVTAPALYAHVVDKRDLLQGIVEREIDGLLAKFDEGRLRAPGGACDRLRAMSIAYVDYGLQNPDLFRAMFLFRPELTSEPREGAPALGSRIQEAFLSEVRGAQAAGELDETDPELAALTLWTTAHGVVTTLLSGPPLHLDLKNRLAEAAVDASLTGLRHGSLVRAA